MALGSGRAAIKILLSNEGGVYIAQCIDWDIAAQARSVNDALKAFEQVFWARVMRDVEKGRRPLNNLEPAPRDICGQFESGRALRDVYDINPPASVTVPTDQVF